jgi:hypothetical protein
MKRTLGAAALLLVWTALPAFAGASIAPVTYVMPTGIDPFFLDYTFSGESYTVSGLQLLSTSYSFNDPILGTVFGGGGVEPEVPTSDNSGIQFNRFEVTTDYSGDIVVSPIQVGLGSFQPWVLVAGSNGHQVVGQAGSALVGEPTFGGKYFGHFEVQNISFPGVDDFAHSNVTIRGFAAVPEPGSVAAGVCMVLSTACGLGYLRRRRA